MAKNSLTEISRWAAAMDSAVAFERLRPSAGARVVLVRVPAFGFAGLFAPDCPPRPLDLDFAFATALLPASHRPRPAPGHQSPG